MYVSLLSVAVPLLAIVDKQTTTYYIIIILLYIAYLSPIP